MDDDFVKSSEFLKSYEWRRLRQEALILYNRKCMCCGAVPSKHNDVVLNVDHIKPRKTYPELALEIGNLQILCNSCNHGKGNWHVEDWREGADFIVTKQWIEDNRTEKGGIRYVQIRALCGRVTHPPSGWLKRMIGKRITIKQKETFEKGKEAEDPKTKLEKQIELLELELKAAELKQKLKKQKRAKKVEKRVEEHKQRLLALNDGSEFD